LVNENMVTAHLPWVISWLISLASLKLVKAILLLKSRISN
ncbi:MAG: hypothetical protein RL096_909, partial [Actinomycetota bacterium]